MRKILKRIVSPILVPFVRWYLRKERKFVYNGITTHIFPGVFHPGFFHSTKFILRYLADKDLRGKSFLELGCGSGLVSIVAAKAGSDVTSSWRTQNIMPTSTMCSLRLFIPIYSIV